MLVSPLLDCFVPISANFCLLFHMWNITGEIIGCNLCFVIMPLSIVSDLHFGSFVFLMRDQLAINIFKKVSYGRRRTERSVQRH